MEQTEPESQSRTQRFRAVISGFVNARREAKLNGKGDPGVAARYEYATWLADAARRVDQIQAVTHVLKATHPDARGTSLHIAPPTLPQHAEIGSHLLNENYPEDIVGNAAALDVFKLLKIEVDGKRLLDWMRTGDSDLRAALSDDNAEAADWMQAFASLVREDSRPASHALAKQVYWLVGEQPQEDSQYHLLQPMFASSLVHAVHSDIQDARFGEANKEARQAFRGKQPTDLVYRDYRGLVARQLGGTKPQNISQLNSERGGMNYLLSSLPPPAWEPRQAPNLLKRESALSTFLWFGGVRELLRTLTRFLKQNPDPTMETRNRREAIERAIGQELALFGVQIRGHYPAGWTRDPACRLRQCEQLWLDPDRTEPPARDDPQYPEWRDDDPAFHLEYDRGDWPDEVAKRFGLWLNGELRKRSDKLILLAEPEMRHFARQAVLEVAWPVPLQRRAKEDVS